jgi:hypothetical protein
MRITICIFTRLILAAAPFLAATVARAQSYAPEVNYHDPVQRVFVVELARVLAWRENLAGAGLTEVRYEVRSDESGACVWMLRWFGAQSAPLREIPLFYAAPTLANGAGFYREAAAPLLAHRWTGLDADAGAGAANATRPPDAGRALDEAFWDGLGQMGSSRMASVRAVIADESAVTNPRDTAAAARMAGQLLACAVPGHASMLTLDSTLAARGAAWLMLAEHAARVDPADPEARAASGRRWAVVLWLARRQAQAMDVWREAGAPAAGTAAAPAAPAAAATTATQARSWWNFALTPHAPGEFYLEAARHDAPAWASALLAVGAVAEGSARNMVACLPLISHFELQSEHDYAPLVAEARSRPHEPVIARWMQTARRDWLRTLDDRINGVDTTKNAARPSLVQPAGGGTAQGSNPQSQNSAASSDSVLAAAVAAARIESERDTAVYPDGALAGFPPLANLIAIACREGAGPLAPVASVTTRDLLNFGWENTGVQLAARHDFLANCYPSPQLAANFKATVAATLPQLAVFFQQNNWDASLPAIDHLDRLQRVEAASAPMFFAPGPVFGVTLPAGTAYSPPRCGYMAMRGWLLRGQSAWALLGLAASSTDATALSQLMRRSHNEGGPLNDHRLLAVLSNPGNAASFRRLPDFDAIRTMFASRLTPGTLPPLARIHAWQTLPPLPPLARVQSAERAFWETPDDDYLLFTLKSYLEVNAPGAIARFHDQAIDLMERPQNGMAAGVYRLLPAMLDLDEDAMTAVLARENAQGFSRYHPRLYPALALGRFAELEEMQTTIAQADPQNVFWGKMMPGLLATWRVLDTPRRLAALRAFAAENTFSIEYLWAFARAAQLTTGERVILFGGDAATGARACVVARLRGDRGAFDAAWKTVFPGGTETVAYNMEHILLWRLRHELFAVRPFTDVETPGLRPADWKSIPRQVAETITERLRPDKAGPTS